MSERKKINIGLFGFGCVGQGLYQVLNLTKGLKAEISKICVKDRTKPRKVDEKLITFNKYDILDDDNINLIVELIDDSQAALEITKEALNRGKAVVTANKKMIAENFQELYDLQIKTGIPILYEGAVAASIPIIRNLEEYYDNDLLTSVEGILNGSSNYILSNIFERNVTFEYALKEAQVKGFAESNPILDIGGFDSKYKLAIIIAHSFGTIVNPEKILNYGIATLNDFDINYAREKGKRLKLIAQCIKKENEINAFVLPKFVDNNELLYRVDYEYNGIITKSFFSESQFFVGKGAGGFPTGSAVLSDISAFTYDYKYEYKKALQDDKNTLDNNFEHNIYVRWTGTNENVIDKSSFSKITEEYKNSNNSFLVGTISNQNLLNADWLKKENIFVALI